MVKTTSIILVAIVYFNFGFLANASESSNIHIEPDCYTHKKYPAYHTSELDASVNGLPNILFILTDDQRWDTVGYRNLFVHTPNLDRLSLEGLRFNQAAVVLPICSPSRATILTGRYTMANGATTGQNPIGDRELSFAHYLNKAGYKTAMIGKWHVPGRGPLDFEFHEVHDLANTREYWRPSVVHNGNEKRAPGTSLDYVVDATIDWIRHCHAEGSSFGIYMSTLEPHNKMYRGGGAERMSDSTLQYYVDHPLDTLPVPANIHDDLANKPKYLKTYRGRRLRVGSRNERPMTPERYRTQRYESISLTTEMDRAFGRLFSVLEELDLRRTTYIIFMGDNGVFDGEHGLMSKALHYEEAVRVPLFITGPGISPGFDDRSLALNTDIAPTILDLAGLDIPANMHGKSLKPTLKTRTPLEREFALLEHPEENHVFDTRPAYALRSHEWKYIRSYEKGNDEPFTFEELYNLHNDPFEMNNLIDDPNQVEIVTMLRELMNHERKRYSQ